jgi:hypothetical protein
LDGIEPGMWQSFHLDHIENNNVVRQILVQKEQQVRVHPTLRIEMEKELAGMYLCVSTSTTNYRNLRFQYPTKDGFDSLLYAHNSRKPLPTPVVVPVISDVDKIAQSEYYLYY